MESHWVHTWANMPMLTEPSDFPPAEFIKKGIAFATTTIRQTIRLSIGTESLLRIRISNAFGTEPLTLTRVTLALAADNRSGTHAIQPDTLRKVTFSGFEEDTYLPAGAQVVSDPVDFGFPLLPRTVVTVGIFLVEGQNAACITSHPGSRTTSYFTRGDTLALEDFGALEFGQVDHWYYISGIEVFVPRQTKALALIGDSITDGRCSTTNGDTRWPDLLLNRLLASAARPAPHHTQPSIAIINQAAGGNRMLTDGLGPNVLSRLDRDILSLSGVSAALVFTGVNDIGTAAPDEAAQEVLTKRLIAGYVQIIMRARAHGLMVFGATVTPFGRRLSPLKDSSYAHPVRERTRQVVNEWIRTSGKFDGVLDFDEALRDVSDAGMLRAEFDSGDGLHPNERAFGVLADVACFALLDRL
ncbi:SGNH hydrolase-type esterase domain-containing protein [Aspergillus pseudoustus]|uniref:SGNH hydrolase-type esterase domain-containing protein n=1 Tax=Aspergillus pseudoustus TaxID=1810923 RepID=A0ABR4JTU4_9EURO